MHMTKERWKVWKFNFDFRQDPLLFHCGGKIRAFHALIGPCIPHKTYHGALYVVIPQEVFVRKIGLIW